MKNKNLFFSSIIILLSVLTINVLLIKYNYFQGQTGSILSIPMWNTDGLYKTGLYLLFAGIIGLTLFAISLKEKRVSFTLLAILLFIIVPPILN